MLTDSLISRRRISQRARFSSTPSVRLPSQTGAFFAVAAWTATAILGVLHGPALQAQGLTVPPLTVPPLTVPSLTVPPVASVGTPVSSKPLSNTDLTQNQSLNAHSPSSQNLGSSSKSQDVIRLEPLPGTGERPVITAMVVSGDGELIAAAGDDHAIRLVSLSTRKTLSVWTGHLDWVRGLAFTSDSDRLASCGNDGLIRVWDTKTLEQVAQVDVGHALDAITFLDDFTLFAIGFSPNIYRVDLRAEKATVDHVCECPDLRTIATSPDNRFLAYAGRNGVLHIRKLASQSPSTSPTEPWSDAPVHTSRARSLHFSDDGSTVTSVGEDRRIVHFDVEEKTITSQTTVRGGKLMGLVPLSPELFAVAGADNTIRIVSWNDTTPQTKLVGHDGSVCVLQKTDRFLISAGFDTTIRIWDLERARTERDTEGRYMHPVAAQFEDSGASSPEAFVSTPVN